MSSPTVHSLSSILFLYGSQTGNAESIAKDLYSKIQTTLNEEHRLKINCMSMLDYITKYSNLIGLADESLIIIVVSNTGSGEFPDNASKFARELNKLRITQSKLLMNTQYAILGLGDSGYDKFNESAKKMDKFLSALSSQRFIDIGLADDSTDLKLVVEPWSNKLMNKIRDSHKISIVRTGSVLSSSGDIIQAEQEEEKKDDDDNKKRDDMDRKEEKMKEPVISTLLTSSLASLSSSPSSSSSSSSSSSLSTSTISSTDECKPQYPDGEHNTVNNEKPKNILENEEKTNESSQQQPSSSLSSSSSSSSSSSQHTPLYTDINARTKPIHSFGPDKLSDKLAKAPISHYALNYDIPSSSSSSSTSTTTTSSSSSSQRSHSTSTHSRPLSALQSCNESFLKRRWYSFTHDTEREFMGSSSVSPAFLTVKTSKYLCISKRVLHMELEIPRGSTAVSYEPGESVGIYVANNIGLVKKLLKRLDIHDIHREFELVQLPSDQINSNSKKKSSSSSSNHIDSLLHLSRPISAFHAFLYCLHIDSNVWSKSFLRLLSEWCYDEKDAIRLRQLASARTDFNNNNNNDIPITQLYTYSQILSERPSLLDLLYEFPSCMPSLSVLIQHLPPLQPRRYSIASSPLLYPNVMHIAFTLAYYDYPHIDLQHKYGRRLGVCTHWLKQIAEIGGFIEKEDMDMKDIDMNMDIDVNNSNNNNNIRSFVPGAIYSTNDRLMIPVFLDRKPEHHFTLPPNTPLITHTSSLLPRPSSVPIALNHHLSLQHDNNDIHRSYDDHTPILNQSRPIIMIGPGTGVAPFRGFIQHRACQMKSIEKGGCSVGWWRGMEVEVPLHMDSTCNSSNNNINNNHSLSPTSQSQYKLPTSNAQPSLYAPNKCTQSTTTSSSSSLTSSASSTTTTTTTTTSSSLTNNHSSFSNLSSSYSQPRGHYDMLDEFTDEPLEMDEAIMDHHSNNTNTNNTTTTNNNNNHSSRSSIYGPMYLYFGCWSPSEYLYGDEFAQFVQQGVLSEFHVAFSREVNNNNNNNISKKVYVQDRLKEQGQHIAELILQQHAYIFICGDGISMPASVYQTIIQILIEHGHLSQQEADNKLKLMKSKHEYVVDVW